MMRQVDSTAGQLGRTNAGGMSEILRGLYVGGYRDANDERQLNDNHITHIVSVHDSPKPFDTKREYLCINASDRANEDLSMYFSLVNDFIHEARRGGGNVLVHCFAGVSRSVTLTTAYLMIVADIGWRDALTVVRGARNRASPNIGFKRLLRIFEEKNMTAERERFRAKFPVAEDSFDDKTMCDKHTTSYQRWVALEDQLRDDHEAWLVDHSAALR